MQQPPLMNHGVMRVLRGLTVTSWARRQQLRVNHVVLASSQTQWESTENHLLYVRSVKLASSQTQPPPARRVNRVQMANSQTK